MPWSWHPSPVLIHRALTDWRGVFGPNASAPNLPGPGCPTFATTVVCVNPFQTQLPQDCSYRQSKAKSLYLQLQYHQWPNEVKPSHQSSTYPKSHKDVILADMLECRTTLAVGFCKNKQTLEDVIQSSCKAKSAFASFSFAFFRHNSQVKQWNRGQIPKCLSCSCHPHWRARNQTIGTVGCQVLLLSPSHVACFNWLKAKKMAQKSSPETDCRSCHPNKTKC